MAQAATTVRISTQTHRVLQELARDSGEAMAAIVDRAIDDYRRKQFLEGLAADFAALKRDPEAWKEELEERAIWDRALADGLDPE